MKLRTQGRLTYLPLFLVGLLLFPGFGIAQDDSDNIPKEPLFKRFSFGLRAGYMWTGLMKEQTIHSADSTTDPPETTESYSRNESQSFTLGPTVQFAITGKLSLVGDLLYKRVGYDAGNIVREQVEDEDVLGERLAANYERTRTDYWDVPLLLRYYKTTVDESSKRLFVEGGVTLRTVSGIKSFREEIVDFDEDLSDTTSVPIDPANSFAPGLTVGGGMQLVDEVNFKVDLGVRYTYWPKRTFDSGAIQSNQHQGEVVIGLSF